MERKTTRKQKYCLKSKELETGKFLSFLLRN